MKTMHFSLPFSNDFAKIEILGGKDMFANDLKQFRKHCNSTFCFQAEVMNKAIWGDMGEDSAMITITPGADNLWHLHFIRTQSGDPSPFDDYVCEVIDEYEKELNEDALFDLLTLHALLPDFAHVMEANKKASEKNSERISELGNKKIVI